MPKKLPLVILTAIITAAGMFAAIRMSFINQLDSQNIQIEALQTENEALETKVNQLSEELQRRDETAGIYCTEALLQQTKAEAEVEEEASSEE